MSEQSATTVCTPAEPSYVRPPRKSDQACIAVFAVVIALNLALVERKWAILFGSGSLSVAPALSWAQRIAFFVVVAGELLLILLVLTRVAAIVVGRTAAVPIAAALYLVAVSIDLNVVRYFRDGIDFAFIRKLGGGSTIDGLAYGIPEIIAWLGVAGPVLLFTAGAVWFLRSRATQFVPVGPSLSIRILGGMGAGAVALSAGVALTSPDLHHALCRTLPHQALTEITSYLTDFDRDGYGLAGVPPDFAPFDRSRHPYAVEIPGNGLDDNGIAGDLAAPVVPTRSPAEWVPSKLARKNVIVIFLDSARADLLHARVNGAYVMPSLRSLPGREFAPVSHTGYSAPSGQAFFTQTMDDGERGGPSLVSRFRALGYATGGFSGQAEGPGVMEAFKDGDVFVDANALPGDRRLHPTTLPAGIGVPAGLVTARFYEWLDALPAGRPFFAYLNWQETHFPYHYKDAPRILTEHPIPRRSITTGNRQWVRETYFNAAAGLDRVLQDLVGMLERKGLFENTIMAVIGDHGEELFEHGSLGHGFSLSLEQNRSLGKLVNSEYAPPEGVPVGLADMGAVIYNSLVRAEADRVPLAGHVLCHVGYLTEPRQVGWVGPNGLTKYDFYTETWSGQSAIGEPLSPAAPDANLIHLWESVVIRIAGAKHPLP